MSAMGEKEFTDLLLSLMNDKKTAIGQLLQDFEVCTANFESMSSIINKIDGMPDKIDIDKLRKSYAVALRSIFSMNRKLILLSLIYYSGGQSDSDIAQTLGKFGRSGEGLKAMIRNKFGNI